MSKVKIIVVCGSGVAMAILAAYKLRGYLDKAGLDVHIDGCGYRELDSRIDQYDLIISNVPAAGKTEKPAFDANPLITGVGEKELVEQIIRKVKEIQAVK
jgi:PTS system galactitol-specific IIB component